MLRPCRQERLQGGRVCALPVLRIPDARLLHPWHGWAEAPSRQGSTKHRQGTRLPAGPQGQDQEGLLFPEPEPTDHVVPQARPLLPRTHTAGEGWGARSVLGRRPTRAARLWAGSKHDPPLIKQII